jgi:hypothetical protein
MSRTVQVQFQRALPVLTGVQLQDFSPVNGTIRQVVMHFPGGCNSLVQIAFGRSNTRQLVPSTGFIALDNATPEFVCNEPVYFNEPLYCIMRNGDAVWPHTVSVIVVIEEDN